MHRLTQLEGFARRPGTPEEVRRYGAGMQPGARVIPGLISNPMARTNWRSVAHESLRPIMPDPDLAVSTPSAADLPEVLSYLLFQRQCNVVAINGGDGTIHAVVNAALGLVTEASSRLNLPVPLPVFLFLNGGGMNMLARVFETRGHPVRTVRRFLHRARGAHIGTIDTRTVPLLRVEETGASVRFGFIFGSELVANALRVYERFGQGYLGLGKLISEAVWGQRRQTERWRRYGHLLSPPHTPVTVDKTTHDPYGCVVATTVPLTILRGMVTAVRHIAASGSLEGLLITETDPGRLLGLIPGLMRARRSDHVRSLAGARRITLFGPYTLDGECFDRVNREQEIVVNGSSWTIRGVWLG